MTDQPQEFDWCVVGGGVTGIYAAFRLTAVGSKVALVEASSSLGRVLTSRAWRGFHVDNGCHLLDYGNETSASFFDAILGDGVVPVDVRYASINRGHRSEEIAVPDLSGLPPDVRSIALSQVESAVHDLRGDGSRQSLADALASRFGKLVGEELARSVPKLSGAEAQSLAGEALEVLSYYKRVRLGEDETIRAIKAKSPALDDRLAISTRGDHLLFQESKGVREWRNYYPARGGMQTLCDRADALLQDMGVSVTKGFRTSGLEIEGRVTVASPEASVCAERVYWTLPQPELAEFLGVEIDLSECFHPVGVHLITYCLPAAAIRPYTYIHDYTPGRLTFRSSAPGIYGRQVHNGLSFVIAETYCASEHSEAETLVSDVWAELKLMGQVDPGAEFEDVNVLKLDAAFMLPRLEWIERRSLFEERLTAFDGKIVRPPLSNRGKRNIFTQVATDLGLP